MIYLLSPSQNFVRQIRDSTLELVSGNILSKTPTPSTPKGVPTATTVAPIALIRSNPARSLTPPTPTISTGLNSSCSSSIRFNVATLPKANGWSALPARPLKPVPDADARTGAYVAVSLGGADGATTSVEPSVFTAVMKEMGQNIVNGEYEHEFSSADIKSVN